MGEWSIDQGKEEHEAKETMGSSGFRCGIVILTGAGSGFILYTQVHTS
jgi:hypothetical protein